jgi:hypothetical protein
LNEGNLADYWTALEGVSHFQCLAWCARHDRGVSLLELEMQSEIDKFLLSWWLLYAQTGRAPRELYHWLFARCVVDPGLCADRLEMYTRANRYAAWFCAALVKQLRYGSARPTAALLSQLRRFYRLSGPQKLHFIESQR